MADFVEVLLPVCLVYANWKVMIRVSESFNFLELSNLDKVGLDALFLLITKLLTSKTDEMAWSQGEQNDLILDTDLQ